MIPIPLTTIVYDRGPGGTFTRQNPISLAGRLTFYDDAIEARGGYKSLRLGFSCAITELKEWLNAGLLRELRVFTPRGRVRWEGVIVELKATIGPIVLTRSLDDMANSFVVSYGSDSGNRGSTSTYSNLTSIAEYGTKQLAHDLSTTTAAGAANWAQTELKKAAWPQRSRETTLTTDTGGSISIELRAIGRYDLLDWLLTTNSSTATAETTAQAINLLASYNSTNSWFSTSSANITVSGHSDTQYIDPNTSYLEKLETLLSQGNSSQNALAWGIYEDGTLHVKEWAGATPAIVTYYRDARDKTVRDVYGNIVEPWDVLPDAMVEDVAMLGMAEDASAIATETREYVARVGLKISSSGIDLTMEPDTLGVTSPKALADAVQNPAGKGATDRSARKSKVARTIKKDTRTIHPSADNPQTPVITGGGSIDTGGHDISYPPGSGSVTGVTGSGVTGQLVKWTSVNAIGTAVAGIDYSAPGHTHVAADITSGVFATGRLGTGTANNTKYLRGDGTWQTLDVTAVGAGTVGGTGTAGRIAQWATGGADLQDSTLIKSGAGVLTLATGNATLTLTISGGSGQIDFSTPGANDVLMYDGTKFTPTALPASAPVTAKYIVQTSDGVLTNEQALGSLGTGLLKNTTSTGVLSIAVAGTDYAAASHAHSAANITDFAEAVDDRVAALLVAGANIALSYNDAGNTLQLDVTGVITGSGVSGRIPVFNGTGSVTSYSGLQWNAGANTLVAVATIAVQGSIAGIDFYDRGTNADLWSVFSQSNELQFWEDDTNAIQYRMSTSAFLPNSAGGHNLGSASNYWNEINYKLLTDRGCLGWYDDGIELQDGRVVSDLEALRQIRPHPYYRTPAGAPRLDYTTLPKHIYRPAPVATAPQVNDEGFVRYRAGEKMGEEGAETTALISLLLGAIKELDQRLQAKGI